MKMKDSNYIENFVKKMNVGYLNSINFDKDLEDSIGSIKKLLNSSFMKEMEKIVAKII
jgi:hypothetical protein